MEHPGRANEDKDAAYRSAIRAGARGALELYAITGSGHMLFPGERGGRHMALDTIRRALEHMGYKGRMTGHGFRGIASTLLHEHEFDHQHIELQLAHTKRDVVSAAYNHALYLKQRAAMMQWYADHLAELQRGKIISIRGEVAG